MTIAIGRAGWDTGLTLNSPRTWSSNGPEVDLAGTLTASTLGRLIVARAQLNGLIDNPDEPVVPVVWSADTSVTGFYEVLDGGVAMSPRGLAALKLDYRLRLRKVSTYPDINSRMLGDAVRTNAHSIAKGSTVPFWAVPDDATMDYIPNASATTRASATGTVKVWYRTDGTVLFNRTNRWQCGAGDYYDGACRFEITPDGSTWYALAGRMLPASHPEFGWRITNGLVRVSASSGDGKILVEHYVAGSWSVSKIYKLTVTTTPTTIGSLRTVTVARNAPEVVTVRLGLDQTNGAVPAAVTVDLTLRRGALWVEGVMSRTAEVVSYLGNSMGVYRNTVEAADTFTGGIRADIPDAQSGYYWIATSLTPTNDVTNGGLYVGSAIDELDFAIGWALGSASTPDTVTSQVYSYFAPLDEGVGFATR